VTPDLVRKLGLPPGIQGAVVIEVLPGGLAAEAGLRPGDVIQEVNRRQVRSAGEFARAVEQAGAGVWSCSSTVAATRPTSSWSGADETHGVAPGGRARA
jgi:S1-C subfamily serine protease